MKNRLTHGKLLKTLQALQPVIASVYDARVRFLDCRDLSPGCLMGLSRFLKALLTLPHTTDYSRYEPMLKRRLIKARHRVFGAPSADFSKGGVLATSLPVSYARTLERFDAEVENLLKTLSQVQCAKGPLQTVADLRAAAVTGQAPHQVPPGQD